MAKKRLDILLVEKGLVESRTKAQSLIMSGCVYFKEEKVSKAGHLFPEDTEFTIKNSTLKWVSRAGFKLEHGLAHFAINVENKIAIDVGASTGGFTQVLLTNGAEKVYAVDVGYGQLDWKLREDSRVIVLDKTNARHLTNDQIPEPADIVVCDASFISLKKVLPAALSLTKDTAHVVALIKPQFEVEKHEVGKGGIISDPALHERVCEDIKNWFANDIGWKVLGITESPIKGTKGNKEFLIACKK